MADWAKLKVVDLKAELKRRGLPQAGLKMELVARLEESDSAEAKPQDVEMDETAQEDVPAVVNGDAHDESHNQELEQNRTTTTEVVEEVQVEEGEPSQETIVPQETLIEPEPTLAPPELEPAPEPEPEPKSDSAPEKQPEITETLVEDPAPDTNIAAPSELTQDVTMGDSESQPHSEPPPKAPQTQRDTSPPTPETQAEPAPEAQKRKRRSLSPIPKDQDMARKRARANFSNPSQPISDVPDIDYDRHVEPSLHPATSALYINNLMRPLRPVDLRAHIVTLAALPGAVPSDEAVTQFHLDFIRTHAFVNLESTQSASRVRQLLHGRVWPNESNRKALHIDFIPPSKIDGWIELEEAGGRRPSTRWEVKYTPSEDGSIQADLVSSSLSTVSRPPPTKPATSSVNAAPLGPRFSSTAPPTGPRAKRPAPPFQPVEDDRLTTAKPVIAYTLAPKDVVEKRIANMRSYYVPNPKNLGRDINRYSFEDGASFVDRGREVFEGIRPPHRERGRGGRGRGGRGGGGFRARSDRYIPGGGRW